MARGTGKISWRQKDANFAKKLIQQYNRKIAYVKKYHPERAAIQPEKINYKSFVNEAKDRSRQYYKGILKNISLYLTKGYDLPYTTKAGVNITLYEYKRAQNELRSINARRRRDMQKYQPSPYKGTMGGVKELNLEPRRNTIQEIQPKHWKKFARGLERQFLDEDIKRKRYKQNFLKALENQLNLQEGDKLYDFVANEKDESLVEAYFNSPYTQLDFVYDASEADVIYRYMYDAFKEIKG